MDSGMKGFWIGFLFLMGIFGSVILALGLGGIVVEGRYVEGGIVTLMACVFLYVTMLVFLWF